MASAAPDGQQCIIPYLTYRDAPEAIAFLTEAFGFEERLRYPMPDGRVGHAELAFGDSVIYLASAYPEMGLQSPLDLPAHHSQLHVWVSDVDRHFERAQRAGATIAVPPTDEDHGARMYRASDPEGHRWMFSMQSRPGNAAGPEGG